MASSAEPTTAPQRDATAILLLDKANNCQKDGVPESRKEGADLASQQCDEIATLRRKLADAETKLGDAEHLLAAEISEKAIWQKEKHDVLEEKAKLEKEKKDLVEENRRLAGGGKTLQDINKDCILNIARSLDLPGECKNKLALEEALKDTKLGGTIMGKPGSFFWKRLEFKGKKGVDLGIFMSSVLSRVHPFVENLTLDTTCDDYKRRLAKEFARKNDRKIDEVLNDAGFPRYYDRNRVKLFKSLPRMPMVKSLGLVSPLSRNPPAGVILEVLCAKLPNLTTLTYLSGLNDDMLQIMTKTSNWRNLEEVEVRYDEKSPQQNWLAAFLNSKTQLRSVDFSDSRFSPKVLSDWLQLGSEPTRRITHLSLRIARDDHMMHISKLLSLATLKINTGRRNSSTEFTDAALTYIGQVRTLERLNLILYYPGFTRRGLVTFFKEASFGLRLGLRQLLLDFTYPVEDDDEDESDYERPDIWSDEAIRELIDRNPKLEDLYLSSLDLVSNEGFTQVNTLCDLRFLDLEFRSGGFSTAAFLGSLQSEKLSRLSSVHIDNPSEKFLRSFINEIRSKFPKCTIGFGLHYWSRGRIIEDQVVQVPPIEFPDIDEDEGQRMRIDSNEISQVPNPKLDDGAYKAEHGIDEGSGDGSTTQGQDLPTSGLG